MDSITHFELPADNVERARKFYTQAFGWSLNPFPGTDYILASTTPSDERGRPKEIGAINGGITKRADPVRTPVVTVKVADIDATLKKVQSLGGSVVQKKQPMADLGFTAYLKDTEGNVLGLWQDAKR